MKAKEVTLVIGGTGKTGRRVAGRLEALGVPVRIGSRQGDPAFDWERPETWAPCLQGVRQVYLAYAPDLAVPGAVDHVQAFCNVASDLGVRRVVLLSGRGEPEAQRGEQVVQRSGLSWTILRCSWFAQNFSEGHLLEPTMSGTVALPAGDVSEPFVDVDDIADVAVAALTDAKHAGKLYELTGPRLLTFAEAAREIAQATGRCVSYVPVSAQAYCAELSHVLPREIAEFLTALFTEVLDGRNAWVASGVQEALGRPARDFADYAKNAASRGAWA